MELQRTAPPGHARRVVQGLRLAARILGGSAFLAWGLFFVEHAVEWLGPALHAGARPPLAALALHAALLVCVPVAWRYEIAGGAALLLTGTAFFLGAIRPGVPFYAASVQVPAVLWIAAGILARRAGLTGVRTA